MHLPEDQSVACELREGKSRRVPATQPHSLTAERISQDVQGWNLWGGCTGASHRDAGMLTGGAQEHLTGAKAQMKLCWGV